MTHVFLQAGEAVHHGKELPFDPFWYGVITLTIGLALLGLLWSFRTSLALDPVPHGHDDLDAGGSDGSAGSDHAGSQH